MAKPRISLNKLGEYLDASPVRRRSIVEDQQDPKAFKASRCGDAREEIVALLERGLQGQERSKAVAAALRAEKVTSEFARQDKAASANAIESFIAASKDIDIEGLTATATEKNISANMSIAGVSVSVRPDAILKDNEGNVVGAVKLHLSKTAKLSEKSLKYIATGLRQHLEAEGFDDIDPSKCFVVDVPAENVAQAPKAFKKQLNDMEAACEEIRSRWAADNG